MVAAQAQPPALSIEPMHRRLGHSLTPPDDNRRVKWTNTHGELSGLHPQESERQAVEAQTALLAFDRQNRMGASDSVARSIKQAIQEEAEAMLADKKVVSGAVTIADNAEKMKVFLTGNDFRGMSTQSTNEQVFSIAVTNADNAEKMKVMLHVYNVLTD